ncbi:hypothetical protein POX_e07114 [Penicillium oxalicum]|uniref:Thioesterase domain-containing protein n=1 Tax=Penicillium oxalicum (strain 114-2 / CGMCC 5302) TaxID=933388 RepID=S7ZHH2_PENO1|nr:hypothetical protein POX_e07114 [Penicillium oxalicum]EPS28141.1 hypothetical protein PDE_03087 [Penicillium oxalicum 114-2]KAI2789087.1 hypothetical protein POX_e07114 [Penicillium oxalicum]
MPNEGIQRPARKLSEFEEFVYECCDGVGSGENWDVCASDSNLRFESATRGPPAKVSFLINVTPEMSNALGTLHGGCAATLIDTLSTIILRGVSEPGKFTMGGVSRNLNVTWLRPVPTGTEIRVVCEVIHVGKRLALLRAEIQRANTGDVCVVGEHGKANTDPEMNQRI